MCPRVLGFVAFALLIAQAPATHSQAPSQAERAAAQQQLQRGAAQGASDAAQRAAKAASEAEAVARDASKAAEAARRALTEAEAAAREAGKAAEAARRAQGEAERAAREAAASSVPVGRAGGQPSVPAPTVPAPLAQRPPAASPAPPQASAPPGRPGPPGQAATLRVGPGQQLKLPSDAARVARDGDTVEIEAGLYTGDVAVWRQSDLVLRGVGGRAHLKAASASAEGKAIWVIRGHRAVVENIEFSDARVSDGNGAGIRLEGTGLTVRNSYFHDNQDGILAGGNRESDIVIESTEFANNGTDDGQAHNIYIGNVRSFTLRNSYVHHAKIGHNVKSRAATNYILYNRIIDAADGTASYTIDLPAGGVGYIIGNVLQQGPETENYTIVSYAAENGAVSADLYLVGNTLVNDRREGGVFLARKLPGKTMLIDNIFSGPGTIQVQGTTIMKGNLIADGAGGGSIERFAPGAEASGNFTASSAGFVDPAKLDYRLKMGSPAIDKGIDPGEADGRALRPAFQYVHPTGAQSRPRKGALDIGAFEYEGG